MDCGNNIKSTKGIKCDLFWILQVMIYNQQILKMLMLAFLRVMINNQHVYIDISVEAILN